MANELTTRRKFAAAQIIVGLNTPLLYSTEFLNVPWTVNFVAIGYWFILPFVCFLFISALALSRSGERFRISRSGLWGATIGAYSAYLLPGVLLGVASATYTGGGVNIGLGLLALAAPAAVPIFMFIGLFVGNSLAQSRAPNPAFKRDAAKARRPLT